MFFDDADIILGGWKPMYGASDVFRFLLASMDGLTSRGVEGRGERGGEGGVISVGTTVSENAVIILIISID